MPARRDLPPADPGSKWCPGFGTDGPHQLAATVENFGARKLTKDGLGDRCRTHGNAYVNAWLKARKANQPFGRGAAAPKPEPEPIAVPTVEPRLVHQDGTEVFTATATQRARRQKVPQGWVQERVGDADFLVPSSPAAVATPEGQQALATVNAAIAAERRRKDAERKRRERAAARRLTQQSVDAEKARRANPATMYD